MKRAERLKKEIDSISDANTGVDFARMLPPLDHSAYDTRKCDGESMEKLAIDILSHRVYDDVRGIAKDILNRVLDGEVEGDDLHDAIWETCDSAVIYTKDQYLYAWLLRDSDDNEELDGGSEWDGKLTTRAFNNLRSEVASMVERCLSEADWDNEDEEE